MTAGHILYKSSHGGYATGVEYKAGQVDANNLPYGVASNRTNRHDRHNGLWSHELYVESDFLEEPDSD